MSSKLCIGFFYNEYEWLPKKLDWCNENGLDMYVIDNYSNDCSWEWLVANRVDCHRFDTNGEFHLARLQHEMMKTIERLQPEWVVYLDADLFIYGEKPLCDVLDEADAMKVENPNVLEYGRINFFQTKEERYRYYKYINQVQTVFKPKGVIGYNADELVHKNKVIMRPEGVMVNYGGTKEHRLEELERRQKAWDNGVHPQIGWHLKEYAKNDWVFDKSELEDIKESEYYKYVKGKI